MAIEALPSTQVDATPILRLVRTTRRLLRITWIITGLALMLGVLTATLTATSLLDLMSPLSSTFRVLAFLVVVVPTLWFALHGVLRPLVRRIPPAKVARRIEQYLPGVHNRLVSAVELHAGEGARPQSQAFVRRLIGEAIERSKEFRPARIVDRRRLQQAIVFALAGSLALIIALLVFPDRLPTALARILLPFSDIPPATGVVYTVEPGDHRMLRGDDLMIIARVTQGVPERMRVELRVDERGAEPKTLWYDLEPDRAETGHWALRLSAFAHSFRYRVHGGGTWSPEYRVIMIDRPRIASVQPVLHYPAYMGIAEPRKNPPEMLDVSGPVDSEVELQVAVAGRAEKGEIQLLSTRTRSIEVKNRRERAWFKERVPEGAAVEGTWEWQSHEGRPSHSNPAAPGGIGQHQFHNVQQGFQVQAGEVFFAYVYLPADAAPETLMIQLHDGQNWERRAYWGADKIGWGEPGTVRRHQAGPLPDAGRWVRLEVPASSLEMEGRTLRGISFAHFGGKSYWGEFGTMPAATRQVRELVVEQRHPLEMTPSAESDQSASLVTWTGRFPLTQDGFYRVELRNELGATNPTMKEARLVAIPDHPPQVALERPGNDLVVSTPQTVPLYLSAHDDFGLSDLVLSVQRNESAAFEGRPVKRYDQVTRADTAVVTLDLSKEGLKPGDTLRYRIEARDRKGQSAQTRDYLIRFAPDDGNAADKRLASFEQEQDRLEEKLSELIEKQENLREKVESLESDYQESLAAAQKAAEQAQQAQESGEQPQSVDAQLDEKAKQQLNQLRQELNQLHGQQQQNVQQGQQVANELKQLAEKTSQLPTLAPEIASQLQSLAESFPQAGVQPLQDLASMIQQSARPEQSSPPLGDLQNQSEYAEANLQAVQERLQALAEAQRQSVTDPVGALDQLHQELSRQNAALVARELQDLQGTLAGMRQELQSLLGNQQQLLQFTPQVPDLLVEDLSKRQAALDARSQEQLAAARELLAADSQQHGNPSQASDSSATPANEPSSALADPAADQANGGDERQSPYRPALGGPAPQLDPQIAELVQPRESSSQSAPLSSNASAAQQRDELGARQRERLRELSMAERSLASDEQTLESLVEQLASSSQPANRSAAAEEPPSGADDELSEVLESPLVERALAMAARARQLDRLLAERNASESGQPQNQQTTSATTRAVVGNLTGATSQAMLVQQLDRLDPETRTLLLNLQPKVREELLQALRDEGPEGYERFIQEYFRNLTKAQQKK